MKQNEVRRDVARRGAMRERASDYGKLNSGLNHISFRVAWMVAFFPVLAAKFITQIALMLDAVASSASACTSAARYRQTILLHLITLMPNGEVTHSAVSVSLSRRGETARDSASERIH